MNEVDKLLVHFANLMGIYYRWWLTCSPENPTDCPIDPDVCRNIISVLDLLEPDGRSKALVIEIKIRDNIAREITGKSWEKASQWWPGLKSI